MGGPGIEPGSVEVRTRCVTLMPTSRLVGRLGIEPSPVGVKTRCTALVLTSLLLACGLCSLRFALALHRVGLLFSGAWKESNLSAERHVGYGHAGTPRTLITPQKRQRPPWFPRAASRCPFRTGLLALDTLLRLGCDLIGGGSHFCIRMSATVKPQNARQRRGFRLHRYRSGIES